MIAARTLDGWARLLAEAAARFDALRDAAAPGSADYLDYRALAHRCEDAADYARDAADDARDAESAAEDRSEQAAAEMSQAARPTGPDHARAP